MKSLYTNIKSLLLAASILTSVTINAVENSNNAEKTNISFEDVKKGNLLSIKDDLNRVLYTEVISKSGHYTKAFDFKNLPNGNYTLELEKDIQIKTIPFNVNNHAIVFNKHKEETYNKPYIYVKENLVNISKLSVNAEPLKISVFGIKKESNTEELLYTETIANKQAIERIYQLESGNYKIVLNSNKKKFTKFINN